MGQKKELIIEYKSLNHIESILKDSVRNNLNSLTIQVNDNLNTWISYGRTPWQTEEEENMPSFRIKHQVDSLPWLGGMPNLEVLSIRFLGLQSLPKGIEQLEHLKKLDISFNYINISDELNKLNKLKNLDELIVFGLGIKKTDRAKLTEENKQLKILFTQKQDVELMEKRGNENK